MKDKTIVFMKADIIFIVIIILAFLIGFQLGVIREKIGDLEDIVFNCGIYEKLKQEVSDGM